MSTPVRYDAAGNIYAVLPAASLEGAASADAIHLCRDGEADGVLMDEGQDTLGRHRFRVLNPDGSEAEISGNGARIFVRYLLDIGRVQPGASLVAATPAREVRCHVTAQGDVVIHMGIIRVGNDAGMQEDILIDGRSYTFMRADAGNPHAVFPSEEAIADETVRTLGPRIETAPRFPQRTNVQFAWPDPDQANLVHARVWERGAGWTASSGSSACAVAAVWRKLTEHERTKDTWRIQMPGGELRVAFRNDEATLSGPVRRLSP